MKILTVIIVIVGAHSMSLEFNDLFDLDNMNERDTKIKASNIIEQPLKLKTQSNAINPPPKTANNKSTLLVSAPLNLNSSPVDSAPNEDSLRAYLEYLQSLYFNNMPNYVAPIQKQPSMEDPLDPADNLNSVMPGNQKTQDEFALSRSYIPPGMYIPVNDQMQISKSFINLNSSTNNNSSGNGQSKSKPKSNSEFVFSSGYNFNYD